VPAAEALTILLFPAASAAMALAAARAFLLRAPGAPGRARAAVRWHLAAGLPPLLLLLLVVAPAPAPVDPRALLDTGAGRALLAYAALVPFLAMAGAWLLGRAAGDPRRRVAKAAETMPLVLVTVNLSYAVAVLASAG
jgi:hypothetical protein